MGSYARSEVGLSGSMRHVIVRYPRPPLSLCPFQSIDMFNFEHE